MGLQQYLRHLRQVNVLDNSGVKTVAKASSPEKHEIRLIGSGVLHA